MGPIPERLGLRSIRPRLYLRSITSFGFLHGTQFQLMSSPALSIIYVWDADYPWDVRTEKVSLALTEAGHDVTIVARNRAQAPEREQLREGAVMRMPSWQWAGRKLDGLLGFPAFFNPRWYSLISRAVRENNADLIIVRDLPLCPTAIAVGRKYGVPVMLDMAENYPAMMADLRLAGRARVLDFFVRNPWLVRCTEAYCIANVDHILTVVEESSERLNAAGVPESRMSIVSNTPPIARAVGLERQANGRCHTEIVYLGLLEVARGIGELIDAMAILNQSQPGQFRLTVIGFGRDAARFEQDAASLELTPSVVRFLGRLPYDEALEVVRQSDVGVIPHRATNSWNTTIPNKLFDYMAVGLPVVTSDAAPCERIVRSSGCGEVFPSGDAAGLAAAILRAAAPGVGARQGEAGRRAVRERFNWEYDTKVLLNAVESVLRAN